MREHSRPLRWSLLLIALSATSLVDACRPGDGSDPPSPQPDAVLPSVVAVVVAAVTTPDAAPGAQQPAKALPTVVPPVVEAAAVESPAQPAENARVLSAAERVVYYALADVPVEYIPILEAIGNCESKHSPGAVGDGGASRGWFQIQEYWFQREGVDWDNAFDPVINLRMALRIRELRGRWGGGGGWERCAELLGIY